MRYECFFDGGCGPINPGGHATAGAVIYDENKRLVWEFSEYLGCGVTFSNNVAEYAAFLALCLRLEKIMTPGDEIVIHGDSDLVVKQMTGRWRIKNGLYVPLARQARSALNYLHSLSRMASGSVEVKWIPRSKNEEADQLARDAYPVAVIS